MRRFFYIAAVIFLILGLGFLFYPIKAPINPYTPKPLWAIRSIDTMKYSRDLAREKLHDTTYISEIDRQVGEIAHAGANYVAIDTPYDDEFLPYLTLWVKAARKYQLKVWFRGNFSGWEKWFDYAPISREEHTSKLTNFIKNNGNLFEDGDIFSSCPECENGGPGDPRQTHDIQGHRQFLIDEYNASLAAFQTIGKKVDPAYNSMNYDVATLIMDSSTTKQTGGVVTIDHYVKNAEILLTDINNLASRSQGKVFLGEFGAPIPDIHGDMNQTDQANWLRLVLTQLSNNTELAGISYWTSEGGTTALWEDGGSPKQAVSIIKEYYTQLQ